MKCDKPASHKITKIVNGKVHDIFLCDEHAQAFSPYLKQSQQHQAHLVELLQQILKQQQAISANTDATEKDEALCPNCNLKFSAYRKTLLLGCSDCYDAFRERIEPDLRRMHGVACQRPEEDIVSSDELAAPVAPTKKAPKKTKSKEQTGVVSIAESAENMASLKARMEKAIGEEDFEEAARLRDAIRQLEKIRAERQVDCARCGAPMEPRMGPEGPILVCTDYPACPNVRRLRGATPE